MLLKKLKGFSTGGNRGCCECPAVHDLQLPFLQTFKIQSSAWEVKEKSPLMICFLSKDGPFFKGFRQSVRD